ncbi:hypothetical protein HY086_00465 [Candidatus Gottesmanbacteria bacterium]|nr:hypothetical protein [Candidatus Gottesmanbacteria bacterium]
MGESDIPSQIYRDTLAEDLRRLRSGGARSKAREILKREKGTSIYRLSDVLRHEEKDKKIFFARELDEQITEKVELHGIVSNEPSLYETFPYIKNVKGAGLGVGMDQMLDIAVNTKLDEVYIIDVSSTESLATKTLLEIGRGHHELFKKYPTTAEYLRYFETNQIPITLEMLSNQFSSEELQIIEKTMRGRLYSNHYEKKAPDGPQYIETYLKFKSYQKNYRSWLSDDGALEKIIGMYEEGKLKPVLGDLRGSNSMTKIATTLLSSNTPLSLVYLSNAPMSFFRLGKNFWINLEKMPVNDNTILIETMGGPGDGISIPRSVLKNPWVRLAMQPIAFHYSVRTLEDIKKEKRGAYKGKTFRDTSTLYPLDNIEDRVRAVLVGVDSRQVGVILPKRGLVIAGLHPEGI